MAPPGGTGGFCERLRYWGRKTPEATALVFLADGETETARLSYAELWSRVETLAARLEATGATGHAVLLVHPSGPEFISSFCACLEAGAVAAPAPAQFRGKARERLAAIARDCGAVGVFGPPAAYGAPGLGLPALDGPHPVAGLARTQRPVAEGTAFLQYTSGSTGDPKGVMVTHDSLAANLDMLTSTFGVDGRTRLVSWLPMFHDMGLVTVLMALSHGLTSVVMPSMAFLVRPRRWLAAVGRYGGTFSGGPNFAYQACVSRIAAEDLAGLDLSSWRNAFCGAEPVRAATLRAFAERFGPSGFRPEALQPAYGLAEATLMVSAARAGRGLTVLAGAGDRELVGCGLAADGSSVAIADPASGGRLADGQVGEVWVSGPHVAAGYLGRPDLSAEIFGARLEGQAGPWLRTGDLGLLHHGELHIAGRLKDLMIIDGTNHHPEDIEAAVQDSHPALGEAAAFSVPVEEGERAVLVQEIARSAIADLDRAAAILAIRRAAAESHGLRLHEVVLVRPASIPRTTSGKVQRARTRELYLAGRLRTF